MKKSYFNIFIFNLVLLIAVPIPFAEARGNIHSEMSPTAAERKTEKVERDVERFEEIENAQAQTDREQAAEREAERLSREACKKDARCRGEMLGSAYLSDPSAEAVQEEAERLAEETERQRIIDSKRFERNGHYRTLAGDDGGGGDPGDGGGKANKPSDGKFYNEEEFCKIKEDQMKYSCELDDSTLKTLGLKDDKANAVKKKLGEWLEKNRYSCSDDNNPKGVIKTPEGMYDINRLEDICKDRDGFVQGLAQAGQIGFAGGTAIAHWRNSSGESRDAANIMDGISDLNFTASAVNLYIGTACRKAINCFKRQCNKHIEVIEDKIDETRASKNNELTNLNNELTALAVASTGATVSQKKIEDKKTEIKNKEDEIKEIPTCTAHLNELGKTRDKADGYKTYSSAAFKQSFWSSVSGAIAKEIEGGYRDEAENKDDEDEEAPSVFSMPGDYGSAGGPPEFAYTGGGDPDKTLGGDDPNDGGGPGNRNPQPDGDDKNEDKSLLAGDEKDKDNSGKNAGEGTGGSGLLARSSKNPLKKVKKSSLAGDDYRGGGLGSHFATGRSNQHGNAASKGRGSNFKFKVSKNEHDSTQQLRKLSSTSNKHKSIFEHMSSLINSYCNKGQQHCR